LSPFFQFIRHIGFFPEKILILSAEMAIGSSLFVNRPQQAELLDNCRRPKIKRNRVTERLSLNFSMFFGVAATLIESTIRDACFERHQVNAQRPPEPL
jgi:hypothetical protein